MDRKVIAEALLEIARERSVTTFVDISGDYDLIETAEKFNIKLPSPDLAVIKTVYAEIDKVNRNGIVLPREAAEKGLPTLIGKQINWEHLGRGHICGYIIDAKIKEDTIEIIGVIFKSLFPEEMEQVKEKFDNKELAVSFEIWNKDPETKESVVHDIDDGTRHISPIIFHGCGLLLTHQPACPKAKVYKLVAKVIEGTEKIVEKVFGEDLIFAQLAIEEPKCKDCETCTCEKEENIVELYELLVAEQSVEITEDEIIGFETDYEAEFEEAKKLTTEQRNALPDEMFAVVVTVKNKTTGESRKIRMFPINDEAHVRNALARLPQASETLKKLGVSQEEVLKKILNRAKELNMTDLLEKYNQTSETVVSPEETKTETSEKVETTSVVETSTEATVAETKSEEAATEEVKSQEAAPVDVKIVEIVTEETIVTTEIPEENGAKSSRKGIRRVTTKRSDGKEEVATEEFEIVNTYSLAQLEEAVNQAKAEKDAEIATLKEEHNKVVTQKDEEIKVKNTELEQKTQEIAKLTPKEEVTEELTVGAVTQKDTYKDIQDEVNEKGFGKKR